MAIVIDSAGTSRQRRRGRLRLLAAAIIVAAATAGVIPTPAQAAKKSGPPAPVPVLETALRQAQERADRGHPSEAMSSPSLRGSTPRSAARDVAGAAGQAPYCIRGDNGIWRDPEPSGPCEIEVGRPTTGGVPKATVIVIAAGGWRSGSYYPDFPGIRSAARPFQDAGFLTATIEHTSAVVDGQGGHGPKAYADLLQWYDLIRSLADLYWSPEHPVCVFGGSSAGHFALMLAATRTPDCIIAEGAPTELRELATAPRGRSAHSAGLGPDLEPQPAYDYATAAFGVHGLNPWSPDRYPAPWYEVPVLMGHLPDDALVPASHMHDFAAKRPTVSAMLLTTTASVTGSSEPVPECSDYALFLERSFTHLCLGGQGGVTAESVAEWRRRAVALVESVAG